jgi:hypothetical protein
MLRIAAPSATVVINLFINYKIIIVVIPTENVDTQSCTRETAVRNIYISKRNIAKGAVYTDRIGEQSETIQVRTKSDMDVIRREEKHPVHKLHANCTINILETERKTQGTRVNRSPSLQNKCSSQG